MVEILYEDNHLIAVFKKSSDLAQSDRTGDLALDSEIKKATWLRNTINREMFFWGLSTGLTVRLAGLLFLPGPQKRLHALMKFSEPGKLKRFTWQLSGKDHPQMKQS